MLDPVFGKKRFKDTMKITNIGMNDVGTKPSKEHRND